MKVKKQVALIVLDGWGYREDPANNAISAAKTPNFKNYWNEYPHMLLEASGLAVGLPSGQMGNSEIGHTTIGAGAIMDTDLVRIAKAIKNNEFVTNAAFVKLFEHVKKHGSTLHIKGLLGEGGVHAHSDHLFAFLRAAKDYGLANVAIHAFTDGRDTPPQSAAGYFKELESVIEKVGIGFIATASGRFYAMDRDNNWDRTEKAEQAIFEGVAGTTTTEKPSAYMNKLYKEGKIDEHIEPIIFVDDTGKGYKVDKNDGVLFFNFRSDRSRQLSKKIVERRDAQNICFVTMTEYDKTLNAEIAFPKRSIETTLAAEISRVGMSQAHIAETEKFPHATYFLNGGREVPYPGEVHILLESRKDVPTHDLAPKMRAESIADKAIEAIEKGTNFIFINFANPDMVGHTANVPAIIEAVEEVDIQLGRVVGALVKNGGIAFITADHGNAEVNIDPTTGEKHTSHTINFVPAILTDASAVPVSDAGVKAPSGGLADIAPTVLKLLGIPQPSAMTGKSLI
jgi:2,3-bisphosphoglycerate-independent phosphoglycerate mutase